MLFVEVFSSERFEAQQYSANWYESRISFRCNVIYNLSFSTFCPTNVPIKPEQYSIRNQSIRKHSGFLFAFYLTLSLLIKWLLRKIEWRISNYAFACVSYFFGHEQFSDVKRRPCHTVKYTRNYVNVAYRCPAENCSAGANPNQWLNGYSNSMTCDLYDARCKD